MGVGINKVDAILGRRGSGKTTHGIAIAKEYLHTHNRKVLIIDTDAERTDYGTKQETPLVTVKNINAFNNAAKSVGRMILEENNFDKSEEAALLVNRTIRNALIIVEDSQKLVPTVLKTARKVSPWQTLIVDSKKNNCAILFMYHDFGYMPPSIFQILDNLIIHKTLVGPITRKGDMGNYPLVIAAWEKVIADKNPYAFEIIENGA